MDEVDRKLLTLLQQDATVAMAELAEQVGLSATPVWKRIQKLEQAGIIVGRVALLDPEQVGVGLIVFVAIEAHEHGGRIFARTTPERARAEAGAARDRARAGLSRGPLDGVPLSWKDLFDTAGTRTEAGTALMATGTVLYLVKRRQKSLGEFGRATPLAFFLAAIAVLLIAYVFVRLCQYYRHAGSVYVFAGSTLGPQAGAIAGLGLMGTYIFYALVTSSAAGIFGASLAPYIATWLAKSYGLQYVGYYLTAAALLTLVGLFAIRETKDEDLSANAE